MPRAKTIKFEIVTLEKVVLEQLVTQVTVPTLEGEITILPDHIPLVSILKPGVIELKNEAGELEIMSVSGGFIEVLRGKVVILADSAERAKELNEERLIAAKKKAEDEKIKAESSDHYDISAVALRLEILAAREKAIYKWRRLKK